jgi:hypothetical protein
LPADWCLQSAAAAEKKIKDAGGNIDMKVRNCVQWPAQHHAPPTASNGCIALSLHPVIL